MAINKDSNGYTFMFAIVLVMIVGAGLAAISLSLKPMQDKNVEVKKKMDILGAINIDSDRKNAEGLYETHMKTDKCVVLDAEGNIKDGLVAFDIDIRTQYRDKTLAPEDRDFPLYVTEVEGAVKYVIPVVGSGLWGPIWGYISVDDDMETIYGTTFDHAGETPGLGAEIKQSFYTDRYLGEKITSKIKSVKDGSGPTTMGAVDGITGGTITSKGVEEMVNRTLEVYVKYFNKIG